MTPGTTPMLSDAEIEVLREGHECYWSRHFLAERERWIELAEALRAARKALEALQATDALALGVVNGQVELPDYVDAIADVIEQGAKALALLSQDERKE